MKARFLMIQGLLALTATAAPSTPETAEDQPWAQLSRQMASSEDAVALEKTIHEKIPGLLPQLRSDAKNQKLLSLWGESRNIDENNLTAGTLTVPKPFLQFFASLLGVSFDPTFTRGHAGLTHTYGYLFSTLNTPYGFKRARYVRHEIEAGLGIPEGLLSGTPKEGSLLLNLSALAGKIAFKGHPEAEQHLKEALSKDHARLPKALARFTPPKGDRILETFEMKGAKGPVTVELQTDLIPFTAPNPHGKNSALLVYSLKTGGEARKLITAFPVETGFLESALKPELMGDSVGLKLKYNALLPDGLMLPEPLTGKRVHHHVAH